MGYTCGHVPMPMYEAAVSPFIGFLRDDRVSVRFYNHGNSLTVIDAFYCQERVTEVKQFADRRQSCAHVTRFLVLVILSSVGGSIFVLTCSKHVVYARWIITAVSL